MSSILAAALAAALAAPQSEPPTQPAVTVTAVRGAQTVDETLASVTVITREDIERSQARDPLELLAGLAGVDLARTGGPGASTALFLRGTAPNQTLVLIDGIRVASANQGVYDFAHLPIDQIERIEIVRGPRASYWGADAIGGVVHVFTRRPRGFEAAARVARYDDHGASASLGMGDAQRGLAVTAGYRDVEGYSAQTPDGFSYDPDDDGYRQRHVGVRAATPLGSQSLSFAGLATHADVEFDQGDTDVRTHSLGATLAGPLAGAWRHALTLGSAREDLTTPAFFALFHTRRETLDWVHEIPTGESGVLGLVANYIHEDGESRDLFSGEPQYARSRSNRALAANWRGAFGPLDGEAALRHDDNTAYGGETTGQLALGWRFGEALRAYASYGEGFRAPTLNELYSPGFGGLFAGNPDLDPEHSRSVELGLRARFEAHRVEARLFRTRLDDLVDFSGENFRARNVERAAVDGLELEWAWTDARWRVDATATVQDARDRRTDLDLVRRPDRKFAASADYRFEQGASVGAEWRLVSSRRDITGDLPGYGLVNLRARWPFAGDWSLGLRLDNALDRDHVLVAGFGTPGRSFGLELRYGGED